MVCGENDIVRYVPPPPGYPLGFDDALRLALRRVREARVTTRWSSASVPGAPSDPLPTDPDWAGGSLYTDHRALTVDAPPDALWRVIEGIGGEQRLVLLPTGMGGTGLARPAGRRGGPAPGAPDAARLRVGDSLDFWRVEEIVPGRLLRLRAEMRLPGLAWLEMYAETDDAGRTRYRQRALFESPRAGGPGLLVERVALPRRGLRRHGPQHRPRRRPRRPPSGTTAPEPIPRRHGRPSRERPRTCASSRRKARWSGSVARQPREECHGHVGRPVHPRSAAARPSAASCWPSAASAEVVPLFVRDRAVDAAGFAAPNRLALLADCLRDLDSGLRDRGGRLVVRSGDLVEEVCAVAGEAEADEVHLAADVSAHAHRREERLRSALAARGCRLHVHDAVTTVLAPGVGHPGPLSDHFAVFTPYFRRWSERSVREPLAAPRRVRVPDRVGSEPLPARGDLTVCPRGCPPVGNGRPGSA
ncbi:hypothetical protein STENM327S_04037 [Streptomyces tendae]